METGSVTRWLKQNGVVITVSVLSFITLVFAYNVEEIRPLLIFVWIAAIMLYFIRGSKNGTT